MFGGISLHHSNILHHVRCMHVRIMLYASYFYGITTYSMQCFFLAEKYDSKIILVVRKKNSKNKKKLGQVKRKAIVFCQVNQ